jgi:hypothetical protein
VDMSSAILFAESVDGHWRPGIGDPTFFGWLTVAAYLVTAAVALAAGIVERRRHPVWLALPANPVFWRAGVTDGSKTGLPARTTGPLYWWLLAAFLLALGINKQLDLQSLVTEIGRNVARDQGWYEGRAAVQKVFIVGVAGVGLACILVACVLFRRAIFQRPIAAIGAVFLLGFVVIRAASFHHVDRFLKVEVAGIRWNWILELGGIALVLASAIAHLRKGPRA